MPRSTPALVTPTLLKWARERAGLKLKTAAERAHVHPHLLPGRTTASQQATVKYFVLVALLFFAQVLVGGATAHYRADAGSFYGIDISGLLPSHLVRTWHLQLAIFWIATAYIAGGLFLAPAVGRREPAGQVTGVNVLFSALVLVVVGSLLGEWLGIHRLLGDLWFWVGHQGWEFLDLGRAWQILLVVGLVLWIGLLWRGIAPARQDPERREVAALFLYAALAIPVFYLPAMFFDSSSHFSVVDTWRFWIIHLWVEGFFELFATVMVAVIFSQLGIVSQLTAARVVYLDAILYLAGGIIGSGHHLDPESRPHLHDGSVWDAGHSAARVCPAAGPHGGRMAASSALRPVGLVGLERWAGADGRDQLVSGGRAPAARRAAARLLACAESCISAHQRRADDRVAPLAR